MNTEEEAAKKGCAGCLGCLTIVIGIPWLILLIVYFSFSKTAEEAVRKVSMQDGLYSAWLTRDDMVDRDSRKAKEAYIDRLSSTLKREVGIDMSVPIYQVLERSEKVKNLTLKCKEKIDGEGLYLICYEVDGKSYQLDFMARDASLLNKELGGADYAGDREYLLRATGTFYKMPPEGIRELINMVRSQELPNN